MPPALESTLHHHGWFLLFVVLLAHVQNMQRSSISPLSSSTHCSPISSAESIYKIEQVLIQYALLLTYFKVHTSQSITVSVRVHQVSVQPTAKVKMSAALHLKLIIPVQSSEVIIIVSVREVTIRDRIHRFTLPAPLFPHLCQLWILRKGQIGRDAVPDAVAQHAVAAAVCADQLFSAR